MKPARLVMPALRWRPETGFTHLWSQARQWLDLGVGGFIVFGVPGARAEEVATLTGRLREAAGRPILIGADFERGAGQQARGVVECPPLAALASLEDPGVISWAGATTARQARALGVNWVFAPVADLDGEPDNPIVQTRAFGSDPRLVGEQVAQWVGACQKEGILACAKHYPGHGRTTADSHDGLPVVSTPADTLAATDEAPFRAAIGAGVASIMTAHVSYPALDPLGRPATLSPPILGRLRDTLGFPGLIVTDALVMEGARRGRGEGELAATAIGAGCDMLLYPADPEAAVAGLAGAAQREESVARRVVESGARYEAALRLLDQPFEPFDPAPGAGAEADVIADRLLERGFLRGVPPRLENGWRLEIVDDDLTGWYPPEPADLVRRGLAARGRFERWDGPPVVLAFASPKAGKGRAGFGPESRHRLGALVPHSALVILFGHPRLTAEIPPGPPILCAWHRQRLMQRAVVRWLAGPPPGGLA